jgi:hypothetical protein
MFLRNTIPPSTVLKRGFATEDGDGGFLSNVSEIY